MCRVEYNSITKHLIRLNRRCKRPGNVLDAVARAFGEFILEIGVLLLKSSAHFDQIDALLLIRLPARLDEVPHILFCEGQIARLDAPLQLHDPHHLLHGDPGPGEHQDPVPVVAGDDAVRREEADLVLTQELVVVVVGEARDPPLPLRLPRGRGGDGAPADAHVRLAPAAGGPPVPLRPVAGAGGEGLRRRVPGAVAHEVPPRQAPPHPVLPLRPVAADREPAPPREPAVELVRRVVRREPLPDVRRRVVVLLRLRRGTRPVLDLLAAAGPLHGGKRRVAAVALEEKGCRSRGHHPGICGFGTGGGSDGGKQQSRIGEDRRARGERGRGRG